MALVGIERAADVRQYGWIERCGVAVFRVSLSRTNAPPPEYFLGANAKN